MEFLRAQLTAQFERGQHDPFGRGRGRIVDGIIVDAGEHLRGAAGEGFIHTSIFAWAPRRPVKSNEPYRMPSHNIRATAGRASKLCGVDPGFWDIWGNYHETTLEARQAILRAKGFDARDAESLARSLAEHAGRSGSALLPPCLVAGEADTLELPVSVSAERVAERAHFAVRAEDGSVSEFDVESAGAAGRGGRRRWTARRGCGSRRGCRSGCRSDTTR